MPSERDRVMVALRERAESLVRAGPRGIDHWARIERVYGLARWLARQEEADRFVVGVAALLHDLPGERPAGMANWAAAAALDGQRLAPRTLSAILEAIEAAEREEARDASLEARVLWDAARLDQLGAIGIVGLLRDGGARSEALYDRRDPFALLRDLDPDRYLIDRLYQCLSTLPQRMHTPTARTIAIRRIGIMLFTLEALRDELAEAHLDALLPESDWLVPTEGGASEPS